MPAAPQALRRRAQPWLGTLVDIALPACDEASFTRSTNAAFARVAEVHRAMSFHDAGSDLAALARAPAGAELAVTTDTWKVLQLALELEALSGGLFNAAVAPQLVARGLLPRPGGAVQPQARTLAQGIVLLPGGGRQARLRVKVPVWADLGGIAKGYAVDCAVDLLQSLGVAQGLVNAGGDMRAFGRHRHPVQLRFEDGLRSVAELQAGALAASCNAAVIESPHIDPRNGCGVHSQQTVVVHAPTAALADGLSKVALLCPATATRLCPALRAQWRAFDYYNG